jgi:hypothetical protein
MDASCRPSVGCSSWRVTCLRSKRRGAAGGAARSSAKVITVPITNDWERIIGYFARIATGATWALEKKLAIIATKLALFVWGLISVFQGIRLDLVSDEHAPFAEFEELFIYLVYASVLFVGTFSFASSRATSFALGVIAVLAFGILIWTNSVPDALGLALSHMELVSAVVLRPAAASIILFIVSDFERRPERERVRVEEK